MASLENQSQPKMAKGLSAHGSGAFGAGGGALLGATLGLATVEAAFLTTAGLAGAFSAAFPAAGVAFSVLIGRRLYPRIIFHRHRWKIAEFPQVIGGNSSASRAHGAFHGESVLVEQWGAQPQSQAKDCVFWHAQE